VASPIAHTFAGFWIFLILAAQWKRWLAAQWRQWVPQLGVLILLANLPDLDFLPGWLDGDANQLHRSFTHSLTFAILISLALSSVWRIAPGFCRSALLYFTAYSSHLLIDFFSGIKIGWTHTGYGMPLFWPLVQRVQFAVDINFWCPSQRFCRLVQPRQRLVVYL
jgi:membrane-bound metal-dependent hydrolase YbcI (DUF457 family)